MGEKYSFTLRPVIGCGGIGLVIHVNIHGFQSIKNLIEIIIDGYSTIGGESNRGKTAIIRAIHAAVSNRAGTDFITEGEHGCEIVIKSLGHTVKWNKDHKSTFYEVDGVKINKPGRGTVPDEVRAAGIYAIKTLDKDLHWPQFHFQWDQPFIIGSYSDTVAAELLGASQDTATITRAVKLVNHDISKCKTKTDFLEKQNQELSITVGKMEQMVLKLNRLQTVVDKTEIDRIAAAKKEYIYRDLIKKYRSSWGAWRVSSLVARASVPGVLDVSYHVRLTDLYRRYTRVCSLVEVSSKNQVVVPEVLGGREYITEINRLYQELSRVSQRIRILGSVASLPQVQRQDGQKIIDRIHSLKRLQKQFFNISKDIDSHVRVMGEIGSELKRVDKEREKINHLVGSIERCPLCSAPMRNGVYCPNEGHSNGGTIQAQGVQVGVDRNAD